MTILGGLDARIVTFESKSSYSDKPQSKPLKVIQDHYDNVCHLTTFVAQAQTLLISSSWDCTSRVWRLDDEDQQSWHHLHTLKGHERAVWAAEVVSATKGEETYLTGEKCVITSCYT
jgi:WD40 repeat protein